MFYEKILQDRGHGGFYILYILSKGRKNLPYTSLIPYILLLVFTSIRNLIPSLGLVFVYYYK